MSSQQAQLDPEAGISTPQERVQRVLDDAEPQYGRSRHRAAEPSADSPTRECLSCGESVPRTIARVNGDNDGCVPACPECQDTELWHRAIEIGNETDIRNGGL